MFFPERLISIRDSDRVLEVGPGSTPHPRSDVLLEYQFDEGEAAAQRGHTPAPALVKPVVYYDGGRFPFDDDAFDYVVCSHVLEHVEDVPAFLAEITRVAKRGYMEYPTAFYEYLHNFRVHLNLLHFDGRQILWMKKHALPFEAFAPLQDFFRRALAAGYEDLIVSLKPHFVEGFEWQHPLGARPATGLAELCPTPVDLPPKPIQAPPTGISLVRELVRRILRRIRR